MVGSAVRAGSIGPSAPRLAAHPAGAQRNEPIPSEPSVAAEGDPAAAAGVGVDAVAAASSSAAAAMPDRLSSSGRDGTKYNDPVSAVEKSKMAS